MFLDVILIAIIIGLVRGGSLANLKSLDLKAVNMIFAAYIIQAAIDYWGTRQFWGGYPYLHIATYFLLFYALYVNRVVPGMKLLLTGTVLNFMPIVFNGGVMPVRGDVMPEHMVEAFANGLGGTHGLITEATRMKFLSDIFYLPLPYQNQLLSIGDLVIDAGILVIFISAMGKRVRV